MLRIIIFCLCTPVLLLSQEDLRLSQAVELTLENNYQIQIERKKLEIAQNTDNWAMAGKIPTVNGTLNVGNQLQRRNDPLSFYTETNSIGLAITPAIEANWTLYDGGRIRLRKSQLTTIATAREGNLKKNIEDAIELTINAYYAAKIQAQQVEVLEQILDLSRDRLGFQGVKQKFGQSGTFEQLQARNAYLNDSTAYLTQVNQYEMACRQLNAAMGLDDLATPFNLTSTLERRPQVYDPSGLETKMLANNPSLQGLFVNRQLAEINTRLEEGGRQPTFGLSAGINYNLIRGTGNGTTAEGMDLALGEAITQQTLSGSVGAYFRYNIFDGGIKRRRIENAKKQEMISQLQVEDLKRLLLQQLTNLLRTYQHQQEMLQISAELKENAAANLELAEKRWKKSLINSFNLRATQLEFLRASQSEFNAIFNLKNTETRLAKLTGELVK